MPWKELALIAISALACGAILWVFIFRGYSFRPKKISAPFVDIEISKFSDLSPVKFFATVSRAILMPASEDVEEAQAVVTATPVILIHGGWHIVCDAFVRKFHAYPDDEHINAAASLIGGGGQNVEFIKMYRDIHIAAIRHSSAVNREFASDYLIRAPSLAERIQGGKYWVSHPVLETYLSSAAQLTGSTSNTLFGARKLLEAKD